MSRQEVVKSIVSDPTHPKHIHYCDFFRLLSVCHAVSIGEKEQEESSDDESSGKEGKTLKQHAMHAVSVMMNRLRSKEDATEGENHEDRPKENMHDLAEQKKKYDARRARKSQKNEKKIEQSDAKKKEKGSASETDSMIANVGKREEVQGKTEKVQVTAAQEEPVSVSVVAQDGNHSPTNSDAQQLRYAGMSPDEVALVQASSENGFTMTRRDVEDGVDTIHVKQHGVHAEHRYQILHEFEFDSDRKRQSVVAVCHDPNTNQSQRVLFTKGADNVMEKLIAAHPESRLPTEAQQQIFHFSTQGLRCLVLAQKELPDEIFKPWETKMKIAGQTMENRKKAIKECWADLERDLSFVGVSAVEER